MLTQVSTLLPGKSPLHGSFVKTDTKGTYSGAASPSQSTLQRESYFAKFGQRIKEEIDNPHDVAIQLSGGYRTRLGMAASISSGSCSLVGLGRTVVIEPELPARKLLNPNVVDSEAVSGGWRYRGTWILRWLPIPSGIKGSFMLGWFYANQRLQGRGHDADPELDMAMTLLKETAADWSNRLKSIVPTTVQSILSRIASTLNIDLFSTSKTETVKTK